MNYVSFCSLLFLHLKLLTTPISISVNAQEIPKYIKSHQNWKLLSESDTTCGQSLSGRIIGGKEATLGQYPWMARIGYIEDEEEPVEYLCGGTIINEKYILTAAHCGPDVMKKELTEVQVGVLDFLQLQDSAQDNSTHAQRIEVESHICHPNFTLEMFHNDICLIRLTESIEFNDYVSPICMPMYSSLQNQSFEGVVMEIAGWGNKEQGIPNHTLMTLKAPIVSNRYCNESYPERPITTTQICAGGELGKDSCNGDSGGPLMKPFSITGPPRYFIIGILSFGKDVCATSNYASVFTIVSQYWQWLLDNIET